LELPAIFRNKRPSAILLGTDTNAYARLALHVVFWLCIFKWFIMQAQWIVGNIDTTSYYLVAFQKNVIIIACFYAISYVLGRKLSNVGIGLLILTILILTLIVYGVTSYPLYHYINAHYTTPSFFQRFVKNTSTQGLWTFIVNPSVTYYYIEQLGFALFIPLSIKIFRISYKANFDKLQLEKDKLLLEVGFLRSQINPHFLFNTLNSVYSLIEDKDEVAANIVYSLSDMMRYSLYQANGKDAEVNKELDFIKSYVAIQKIRHSKRLTITTEFSEEVKDFRIPPLLLIDFVENAFKHGVDQISKDAWVKISATMVNKNEFCFHISNLKPETEVRSGAEGIGIANAKRRLNILYPDRHQLSIVATDETYSVTLKIW
jgi:two-component system LytT family sensor kinase